MSQPRSQARHRVRALENPGFRRLVLLAAGIPIAAFYAWTTLLQPFLFRPDFPDFSQCFRAAERLRGGTDPYLPFFQVNHYSYSGTECAYAPLTAWLVTPLTPLGYENAALLVLVLLQLCVALFLVLTYRALRPLSGDEVALGVLLALGFEPLFANLWNDQSNLLVLVLSGAVLAAYVTGDRWWGGACYGLALALKPVQPAVGLLLIWGRRRWMVAASVVAGVLVSLLPGPGLLLEYLTRVLPREAGGTGFRDNAAPAGFLERLFHPASFYDASAPGGVAVKLLWLAVVLAILGLSWWRLGRTPREDGLGRAVEMALAVTVSTLVLSISHSFHLVLLLLPILVLLRVGIARGDVALLACAGAAWLLVGPVHSSMLSAIGNHFTQDLVLRVWNESQLLGILVLWAGCLRALGAPAAVTARPSSRPSLP